MNDLWLLAQSIDKIILVASSAAVCLFFIVFNFRWAIYAWTLLAGIIGIPVLVVRESSLMFSELMLALLLFFWLLKKTTRIGFFNLPEHARCNTKIEYSIWIMIGAFILSSGVNIFFPDTRAGGEHVYLAGKLLALFLYVASAMTALFIADSIRSLEDVIKICVLLVFTAIYTFISENLPGEGFFSGLKYFQQDVGWTWLSVSNLLAFCLAFLVFHPNTGRKLPVLLVVFFLVFQIFSPYFLGIATYKAIIVANFSILLVVFYFKSKKTFFILCCTSLIIFMGTLSMYRYYLAQESKEGSLGSNFGARTVVWQHSFLIFLKNPFFGVGPYNYYDQSLALAEERQHFDKRWGVMTSPHSQYLQILSETGILGTVAFAYFLFELFRLIRFFLKNPAGLKIKIITSAVSAILVSRIVIGALGDYYIPQYHNGGLQNFSTTVYFWVCLGTLIGLKKIQTIEDEKEKTAQVMESTYLSA